MSLQPWTLSMTCTRRYRVVETLSHLLPQDLSAPGRRAYVRSYVPLQDNPEVTKVSDMARHAGEAWRAIHPDKRAEYEKMSADNKVFVAATYAVDCCDLPCHKTHKLNRMQVIPERQAPVCACSDVAAFCCGY
jgi:hypothetical protein